MTAPPTCWALTDGRASMRNQCLGLAEAAGLDARVLVVRARAPWRWLAPTFWPRPFAAVGPGGDALAPPWPDVLIAAGQNLATLSMAVRRASEGRTFTVQIESPRRALRHFDLVVPPRHDGLTGANVVPTLRAINRITPERLEKAAARFGPRFAHVRRPLVAVLVGGDSRRYRMTDAVTRALADGLARLADGGSGIVLTASRRTPERALAHLRERLGAKAEIWDGTGENPYEGYLALADHLVVTCDSVLMVSEAAATGKPVHLVALEGGGGKFERFHRTLAGEGITRPFAVTPAGTLESWSYRPLNDAASVARVLRERLQSRRPEAGGGDPRSGPQGGPACPS